MEGINFTDIICGAFSLIGMIAVALISNHTRSEAKRGADANAVTQEEITKINNRLDKQEKGISNINSKLAKQDKRLARNDLQTSRIDLRQALEHSRDNIPAVLELAWTYFVELHGDADLGPKFLQWVEEMRVRQWAKDHKYPLGTIIRCAKHPNGGNK